MFIDSCICFRVYEKISVLHIANKDSVCNGQCNMHTFRLVSFAVVVRSSVHLIISPVLRATMLVSSDSLLYRIAHQNPYFYFYTMIGSFRLLHMRRYQTTVKKYPKSVKLYVWNETVVYARETNTVDAANAQLEFNTVDESEWDRARQERRVNFDFDATKCSNVWRILVNGSI